MNTPRATGVLTAIVAVSVALVASTLVVALLEDGFGIANGSAVYLVAVSIVALRLGAWPAVATALGSFLAYNFLFIDPRFTFRVGRPEELLTLFLLLFVGVVIGRLSGLQRERAREAQRREGEARALFGISRELVRSDDLSEALGAIGERLSDATAMDRVWIGLGPTLAQERIISDTRSSEPVPPTDGSHSVLGRDAREGAATWVHVHPPSARRSSADASGRLYRVELRAGDETAGSVWALRRAPGAPRLEETRLLAATADQVGAAIRRDRLLQQAAELEVARRSEDLKSALVDSVSHDLRTPLAAIRAAAGNLADPGMPLTDDERRSIAAGIDAEAERLSHLVGNLLDMSRIQGGALVPQVELFPLDELVRPVIERASFADPSSRIVSEIPDDLPPVQVDGALMDRVLSNLVENAVRHAPPGSTVRLRAAAGSDSAVAITVEDGGPGVPDEALESIFERFSRVDERPTRDRRGFGLGLAVVRGLIESMGGSARATRSELGGLAVTVTVPADPGAPQP